MTDFAASITRCPIPFDAAMGREAAQGFAHHPGQVQDLIAGAAGCSPYLKDLLRKQGDWLNGALAQGADAALDIVIRLR